MTTLTLTMAVLSGLLWFVAMVFFLLRWLSRSLRFRRYSPDNEYAVLMLRRLSRSLRFRRYSPDNEYAVLIKFKVASESFQPFPKGRQLSYSGDWILWEEDDGLVAICVKNWFVT